LRKIELESNRLIHSMARINAEQALTQINARCRARCTFESEHASESDVGAFQ
jgi:hypothetical protein